METQETSSINYSVKYDKKYDYKDDFDYIKKYSLKERKEQYNKAKKLYPNKIPIIIEKDRFTKNLNDIDKNKYLVNKELTLAQFMFVIRKKLNVTPEKAIFLYINGKLYPSSENIENIYNKEINIDNEEECGFLFIKYAGENTFG
jgi:GABA(A) receptor-associated protein